MGLREWRNGNKWDAKSQLIKVWAIRRVGACRICGHLGAELFGILYAGVRCAQRIARAIRASAGLFTGWRLRQIFALAGVYAVRV